MPALAERWEIAADGRMYTFHLRPGVRFHNGKPMGAEDVKYSIDKILDTQTASPWRPWLGPVRDVKVVDASTLQISLENPFPGLLGGLASLRASVVLPAGAGEAENLNLTAIGTGPFKLVEYVPLERLVYARNPDYWDKQLPYLDGMTFKILPDENARHAALRAGQLQYAVISPQGAAPLAQAGQLSVLRTPFAWVAIMQVNVTRPPLNDPRVRRALRMAVDTNEVIQKAVFGTGTASGPIPTGYGDWFVPPDRLPYLKPDLEGAKRLLAEAGFPDGKGLKLTITTSPQYPEFVASATVVQEAFRRIGVEASIESIEWGQLAERNRKHDYDLLNSANTFRPDPDGYIYPQFHSKGNINNGYANARLDGLIERARTTTAHADRKALYQEIQKTLLEECPAYWWYDKLNVEVVSTRLRGYTPSFIGRRFFLKHAWLA